MTIYRPSYVVTRVIVKGKGPFPIKMLMLDSCVPSTLLDARTIERSLIVDDDTPREYAVRLRRFKTSAQIEKDSFELWASYGCEIFEDNPFLEP